MPDKTLLSEIHSTHFEIKLNRPEKRNALDADLMIELTETLLDFGQKVEDQKYLIFSGEGTVFCAGADINWMKSMADYSFEENKEDSEKLFNLFFALYSFPLPVISLVQGAAFGGALGLLAASDYVFIEKETKLCFSEVKLGLSPAVISTFVINRTNHPKAKSLMLSGEIFNEDTAIEVGLASGPMREKEGLVKSLEQAGREALVETKALLRAQALVNPRDFKNFTIETISKLRLSDEAQNRMKAFLDKKG
jgi:methylglutaconyl-CoA hydratase